MNKTLVFALLVGLLPQSTWAIEVADFKFGMVCPSTGSAAAWICHETEDVLITGQGQCVYNKKRAPCTWYGFSFKYSGAKKSDVFKCTYTTTAPVTSVNPRAVVSEPQQSGKYEFTVSEGDGIFFNPQYSIFRIKGTVGETIKQQTECRVNGAKVFVFNFNFIYPGK